MARTTAELVRGIIETDDVNIPDIQPFIDVANSLVTECCIDSGYDTARLELIERWLSAHFYAIRDLRRDMEKADVVQERFQYKLGLNLQVTVYGQQAIVIDTKGSLAKISKDADEGNNNATGLAWLGEDRD